jgi:hypothetical protein
MPADLADVALIIERLRTAGRLDRVFIDGEWVLPQGQARASVIDPSTEESVARDVSRVRSLITPKQLY